MDIGVQWSSAVQVRRVRGVIHSLDLNDLPDQPGVYVFGRRWGKGFEALYVGKAMNIRSRVKGQLNNLRLMSHIRGAKSGSRILMAGIVVTKPGQKVDKCLTLVEKTLIRYFLSEGHDLVNVQGTQLKRHQVASIKIPIWFVPRSMYLDTDR